MLKERTDCKFSSMRHEVCIFFIFLYNCLLFLCFQQVNNFTAELQAKPEYHKFLIGRGGANIRRVRDKTGARVIFPSPDDAEQELITIVGKEEAVRQAQKELECLLKNLVNTYIVWL